MFYTNINVKRCRVRCLHDPNDYNVNKSKKEQNPIALNNIFNYN